jgi:hypothetical protein
VELQQEKSNSWKMMQGSWGSNWLVFFLWIFKSTYLWLFILRINWEIGYAWLLFGSWFDFKMIWSDNECSHLTSYPYPNKF